MPRATPQSKARDQELLERYVDLDVGRYVHGRADARLRDSGVNVWAIVMHLRLYEGDIDKVADTYEISREEVEAALVYYRRNKRFIDAFLTLNEA